jgi:pyruvate formate lyase activating enzyme
MKRLKENDLIDGVVVTGGEPLLHGGLPFDLAAIDNIGLDIKLDTNGTLPQELKNTLPLLDYIAMDVKSDKHGYKLLGGDYDAVAESVKIVMDSGIDYEFRCTAVEPFLSEQTAWEIGEMVSGAKRFYIQKPRLEKVLYPLYPMEPTEDLDEIASVLESYVAEVFIR